MQSSTLKTMVIQSLLVLLCTCTLFAIVPLSVQASASLQSTSNESTTTVTTTVPTNEQSTTTSTNGDSLKTGEAKNATETRRIQLNSEDAGKVGGILIVLLVLSTVFEIALNPIFRWRHFITRFDQKGLKTPIQITLALLLFWNFQLDIVRDLLNVMLVTDQPVQSSWPGQILTAFLIAGGSSAIYELFERLGIHNYEKRRAQVLDEANRNKSAEKDSPTATSPASATTTPRAVPIVKR
ncbi:MAG: hypothetical protein ACOYNY_44345 [Caldilineaceae bacterium]